MFDKGDDAKTRFAASPYLWKVSRCFIENDTLFYRKRHVVLLKTTRCFVENDTLFYWKRYVVLLKTIRCFIENETLFSWKQAVTFCNLRVSFQRTIWSHNRQKRCPKLRHEKRGVELCENTCDLLLSRARIRAYVQEFFCFCCHKCHTLLRNPL